MLWTMVHTKEKAVFDKLGDNNNAPRHSDTWEQEKSNCAQRTLPICTALGSIRKVGTQRIAVHSAFGR